MPNNKIHIIGDNKPKEKKKKPYKYKPSDVFILPNKNTTKTK